MAKQEKRPPHVPQQQAQMSIDRETQRRFWREHQKLSARADTPEEQALLLGYLQHQEEQKTKRLWLVLAVVALLAALALLVFAPPGRETLSYWIGGALLIFAAGAAGYKRVWGKSKLFSVGADQDRRDL